MVPRAHRHPLEQFNKGIILQTAPDLLPGHGARKTVIDRRPRFGFQNIPHFRLARLVFMMPGVAVTGMDLHRKVLCRVDQLD